MGGGHWQPWADPPPPGCCGAVELQRPHRETRTGLKIRCWISPIAATLFATTGQPSTAWLRRCDQRRRGATTGETTSHSQLAVGDINRRFDGIRLQRLES